MKRNDAETIFNDIFNTLSEKQKDVGDLIDGYMSNTSKTTPNPSIDILDNDESVTVMVDLPGIEREDIKVDITENFLEITANYTDEADDNGRTFLRKERYYGVLNRKISLPKELNINETSAKFENGVLIMTIPKIVDNNKFEVKVD